MTFPLPIYQHYKGRYYQITTFELKAYSASEVNILPDNFFCAATIEATMEECIVYKTSDGSYVLITENESFHNQPLVLYNPVSSTLNYWVRTLDDFNEVIVEKFPKVKRFARILS